jgi:hypothetical protein
MGDVLAIVDRRTFESEHPERGIPDLGDRLPWDDYKSRHYLLDKYLEEGDRLFLVTVRPVGRLWLVAVYEDVRREDGWNGRGPNRVPIIDITPLKRKLRFHTDNGIAAPDDKLGNSLQNPRQLTSRDVELLEAELARRHLRLQPARVRSMEMEAREGRKIAFEASRYERDPELVRKVLRRDGYRCRHCGFASAGYFASGLGSRIVHVHHVRPLKDGERNTRPSDLVTLCPTCHCMAHALAAAHGREDHVSLRLLDKYYPIAGGRARRRSAP